MIHRTKSCGVTLTPSTQILTSKYVRELRICGKPLSLGRLTWPILNRDENPNRTAAESHLGQPPLRRPEHPPPILAGV
jgi:hypothetical protein